MSIGQYLKDMYQHPEKYNKFWIAILTAILNGLVTTFGDNPVVAGLVSVAGALGVFLVPNKRP